MKELISRAIKGHRLLRLIYENKRRVTIEPHALGRTEGGEDALLCWQVAPPVSQAAAWRVFQLSKVSEMQMLDEGFEADRGGHSPPVGELAITYQTAR